MIDSDGDKRWWDLVEAAQSETRILGSNDNILLLPYTESQRILRPE